MPLVLQPASCCDICMEDYDYDNLSQSPHAIDCGHIFCKTCICGIVPKVCPFCRKSFSIGRKLHVEASKSVSSVDIQSNVLLERIALAFDNSSAEETLVVITEVNDWISTHSDWDDDNSLKPLRRALDALCRHRSYIDYADDLATLRGVESSLRMELMEQKETAINLQNKLQCDLKTISGTLQAERNGFLAKLFAEREASAKAQKELQNIIRETFRIFQALQTENGRLLSKLQTTQSTEGTLSVINRDASDTQELPCLPDLGAEILAIPDWPFTSHNSGPSPYTHSYSQSVNKHRDSNPRTTGAVSVHAFEAFPVSKDSVHQVDISSHPKSFQINLLSQPEDIITEVQNRSQAALAYKVMQAPVGQNLDSQTLSLSQHDSSAALKRPRRLLKMASTPTLWKKANKHLSGGDGQGVGISAAARGQVGCNILPETPPETLDATTGAEQNIAEDRKVLTQRWPHSWRIFSS